MLDPARIIMALPLLALVACNQTTPTTPPDSSGEAPAMPEGPDAEGDEVFDDEPEPEDGPDVEGAG